MIVVNKSADDTKTYIASVGTSLIWSNLFIVAAKSEVEAVNIVADYLEVHKDTNLYYDHAEFETLASCSKYKTAENFAEAHNLTRCGSHGVYIELLNIEEVII